MTVLATDNFNRADAADLGAPWVERAGGFGAKILSNAASADDVTTDCEALYDGVWPSNQYSKGAFATTGGSVSGRGAGLALRGSLVPLTYYRFTANHDASANCQLLKKIGGVSTVLTTFTQAWTDGDTWTFEVNGHTLVVYYLGTIVQTYADNSIVGSGDFGLAFSSTTTTVSVDNWEGGTTPTMGYLNQNKLRPRPFAPGLAR